MRNGLVGASVPRVEDDRLLRGDGRFIADLVPEGALHCAFVRSPFAHASFRHGTPAPPPGVQVFFAEELGLGAVPSYHEHDVVSDALRRHAGLRQLDVHQPVLARGRVRFVGQPVAAVLAPDRYAAEDAASAVPVDYDPLPVVVDAVAAQAPGAPLLEESVPRNRSVEFEIRVGDVDAARREAEIVVEGVFSFSRQAGSPLECRGAVADWDGERLTVRSATQIPHALRDCIARTLGLDASRIRVVVPDVGGGFGVKGAISAEELAVAALAVRLRRPVAWIEDRWEHFVSAIHSRDQRHAISVAARGDGTLLAVDDAFTVDAGGYDPFAKTVPHNTAAHLPGPYRVPALRLAGASVLTNKVPAAPYRGSGRPEATFARERALDRLARALRITPVELRRRNLLTGADLPYDTGIVYRDGAPIVYDGVDVLRCLDAALEANDASSLPPAAAGFRRGTGVACYSFSSGKGPWETASVELGDDGVVTISTGAASQGQSHETVWAQIAADELGLPLSSCRVVQGDTDVLGRGWGTMASRSAVAAGNAVALAARALREQLEQGGERRAEAVFSPPTVNWAGGAHLAVIDVDVDLRTVRLVAYVAAFDHGPLLNPAVAEGQLLGAIAQGIGGALLEEMAYDEGGQPVASLVDYRLPTALDVPPVVLVQAGATPTDRNPLGIRGLGEAGIVAPAAAIANAVEDALWELGARIEAVPVTPARLHEALRAAAPLPRGR
jgi:carbon-monoxide dehydrogenase large subunit